jgi:preprotein translocase subunit SecY
VTSKFLLTFKPIISIIPEVRRPTQELSFGRKILFTLGVLVIYDLLSITALIGAAIGGGDPFGFIRAITASSYASLAELGILPLLLAGLIMYTLVGLKIIKIDVDNQSERLLYNGTMKILAFLITIGGAILLLLSGIFGPSSPCPGDHIILFLQLFIGGIIIIYLDEIIRKGWGYGSGISLFIIGAGLGKIMNALIAPNNIIEGANYITSAKGIFFAFFYWFVEEGPLAAIGNLMFRYNTDPSHRLNLPSLSIFSLILTCILFFLVIYVETRQKKITTNSETSKIGYLTPLIPILLVTTVFVTVRFISFFFWQINGGEGSNNPLVSFLGTFRLDPITYQIIPTGGLAYFLTPIVPIFEGILIDPIGTISQVIIYSAIFLFLFRWFKKIGFLLLELTSEDHSSRVINQRWTKIALIAIVADIFNLLGIGIGIVLLALVLTDYYKLFTMKDHPSFVRFDISSPDEQIIEKTEFEPIEERTFWYLVILLGVGLFVLRFIMFVILGREM